MFRYVITLCLLVGLSSAQRSLLAKEKIAQSRSLAADFLLPNNISVQLYTIELEPNFDTDTFTGSVSIQFTTLISTNNLTLHANQLNINLSSIVLLNPDGTAANNSIISTSTSNDTRHFFNITFATPLSAFQSYVISFGSFSGILNLNNVGFYLARYVDENGNVVKLATTQFEEIGARQAFPSFDEPALKAQFDIAMIRTPERQTISNMPLINSTTISPGRIRDVFQRTVIMSTYLIAFVVSDFTYVGRDVHRVFGRPQSIAAGRGEYALDVSIGILDAIADFVGVPYTLPKMDQVGMSDDYFAAGAMENWGLVIYREAYLMYINNVSTSSTRETIATIVAHEYGHQWFGNLVSPVWWTYIWLNEGFATYLEYYGASVVEEDMELMEQMLVKSVHYALDRDNTDYTRPMNQEAGSPSDISSLFDVIAYDKSGAVIRMVEGFLTTPVFRRGLNIYLNRMQFSAAQPSDLYSSWQQALDEVGFQILPPGETIESVMTTWDSNPGYPLLTVTRNYAAGTVTFGQQRFISTNSTNTYDNLWYIPISYATPTFNPNFVSTTPVVWLTIRAGFTTLPGLGPDDWLIVNVQQRGYYRVNYDLVNWFRIIALLNSDNFSIVPKTNRANLLQDVFHFARYGYIDYQVALDLSTYLVRETDYVPIYPFISVISFLNTYLSNTASYGNFQAYTLQLLNASLNSVGFVESASDRHVTKLNRINTLTWVCRFDGGNCRTAALQQLRTWQNNSAAFIPPNLQTVIACSALRIGDQADWDFVYQQYLNASEAVVRTRLLNALGCSENELILSNFLNLVVDTNSGFPYSDRSSAWSSVYSASNFGRNFAFGYLRLFYSSITNAFTPSQINSILNGIASRFSNEAQVSELQFFANTVGGGAGFTSAINTALANLNWANNNLASALSWFGTTRWTSSKSM